MEMPAHGSAAPGETSQSKQSRPTRFLASIKLHLAQQRVFCAGGPCEQSSREINKNIVGASGARNV